MLRRPLVVVGALTALLSPVVAAGQTLEAMSDEQSWVQGGPYRLITRVFKSNGISQHPVLVVVLHGDAPFNKPEYHYAFAAKAAAIGQDVVAIGLLRPGYTDSQDRRSEGERGQAVGDNWNAANTDAIAHAIETLKRRWHARRVVIAGHSGGAAIAANTLGRHPGLIDAALLVSCPCDVRKWRDSMYRLTGKAVFQGTIDTVSPVEQIRGISNHVRITLIVGSDDKVAPPSLSREYTSAATKLGKTIRLVELEGKEHEIFLDTAVLAEFARMLK